MFNLKSVALIFLLIVASYPFSTYAEAEFRAPNFTVSTINGEQFELKDKWLEKPTLLYFWATWCPYCKKATPSLVTIHTEFYDAINVIGVNVGIEDEEADIVRYMSEYDIAFPIVFDQSHEISNAYQVIGTPVIAIVSTEGELLYRGHTLPVGFIDYLRSIKEGD